MTNKRPIPKFKKGNTVLVYDEGQQFGTFKALADKLGSKKYKEDRNLKENIIVTIIDFGFRGDYRTHPGMDWEGDYTIPIYLVKAEDGFEYLISEAGVRNAGWFTRLLVS